eukprot:4328362-Pleurochrysis_carterae.AAC.2
MASACACPLPSRATENVSVVGEGGGGLAQSLGVRPVHAWHVAGSRVRRRVACCDGAEHQQVSVGPRCARACQRRRSSCHHRLRLLLLGSLVCFVLCFPLLVLLLLRQAFGSEGGSLSLCRDALGKRQPTLRNTVCQPEPVQLHRLHQRRLECIRFAEDAHGAIRVGTCTLAEKVLRRQVFEDHQQPETTVEGRLCGRHRRVDLHAPHELDTLAFDGCARLAQKGRDGIGNS